MGGMSNNIPVLLEGLSMAALLLLSCVGYGYRLSRLTGAGGSHWAELTIYGMAILIFIGGTLSVTGLVSEAANILALCVGALLSLPLLKEKTRKPSRGKFPADMTGWLIFSSALLVGTLCVATLALTSLGSLMPFWHDQCDDWVSYFYFPKAMLETGGLSEPFNLRRLGGLGGNVYLQSLLFPSLNISSLPFLDVGLGLFLIWGLTRGFAEQFSRSGRYSVLRRELLALFSLAAGYSMILFNHSPSFLPFALVLATLQQMFRLHRQETIHVKDMIPLVLTMSAALTFRNNLAVFLSLAFLSFQFINPGGLRNGAQLAKVNAVSIIVACLYLMPWMILSYKSSGTILFPLMKGNYTYAAGLSMPMSLADKGRFIMENITCSQVSVLLGLLLTSALMRKYTSFVAALLTISVLSVIATSLALTASDTYNIQRYYQSVVLPALVVALGVLSSDYAGDRRPPPPMLRTACQATAAAMVLWWLLSPVSLTFNRPGNAVMQKFSRYGLARGNLKGFAAGSKSLYQRDLESYWRQDDAFSYKQVQDMLPEGSKFISAVAKPYYWDSRKHRIHTIDCLGQASPPPGMPFFKGSEAMREYLAGQGYRYMVFTRPETNNCLYSRSRWVIARRGDRYLWKNWAPYFLDFFENQKSLKKRGGLVYSNRHLQVIDLHIADNPEGANAGR